MSDIDHDAEFDKAFEGFGDAPAPATPPAEPPKQDDQPAPPAVEPPKEDPKKDDQPKPEEPKKEDEAAPPAGDAPKKEEEPKPAPAPETPPAPEAPKPLTEDSVRSIIQNIQTQERASVKELETTTNDVLEAYYPDGLSNVLTTEDGRPLRTPQDVINAAAAQGAEMSMEEATQWLMNEQYKLDTEVRGIQENARKIAETTINFKRDSISALQKYEPLFKWQPSLQQKVWDILKAQVKADVQKGVILSAPDVMSFYDTYLEPYQKAYEFSLGQPATNPNPPAPEPPKPGAEDRLDENGDGGGGGEPDDPNNFAQQTVKELAKGM